MSEYVKIEDVLSKLYLSHKDVTYIDKNAAADRIKKIQGIDIVRCKECARWDKSIEGHINIDDHLCRMHLWWTLETDYCSDGEREGE